MGNAYATVCGESGMNKIKNACCILCLIVIVAGGLVLLCNRSAIILGEKSTYDVVAADGFSFYVTEVSEEYVEAELVNHSAETLCWGSGFALEKQEAGGWYNVEPQMPDGIKMVWNDILYLLDGGERMTLTFSLLYRGDLPQGKYRIVRQFSFEEQGNSEGDYVAAEFFIE